jgi:hypothetical protein
LSHRDSSPLAKWARLLIWAATILLVFTSGSRLSTLAQDLAPQQSTSTPFPPASAKAKEPLSQIAVLEGVTKTIAGVPGYAWRHGCGPTTVGMVLGYYATLPTNGFPDLFAGNASTQTESVNQSLASQGSGMRGSGLQLHYEDYALPMDSGQASAIPDSSVNYPLGCHVNNSIADYMHTSWSSDNNTYGSTWSSKISTAFTSYVLQRNPQYVPQTSQYYMDSNLTWSVLTNEINNNRPMVFLVDSNGDGKTDHYVTVIAYADAPTLQYGCLDTWYPYDRIRWCEFKPMSSTYAWGVWGGWSFGLSHGTSPTPGAPSTPSPANGATGVSTAPTLSWTAGANTNSYDVYFGTSSSPPLAGNTTATSYPRSGLSSGMTYYWQVVAKNANGNTASSPVWSFTTAAPPTAPSISGVTSSDITASGATISWTTDLASDSQVEYGTTTFYGNNTTLDTSLVTSHARALTGLAAATAYHYRVKSRSAAGVLAISGDYTFSTPDGSTPAISGVAAIAIGATGATIVWTTNVATDSQVEYGRTIAYGGSTGLDANSVTSHAVSLSGLAEGTLYHYRVKSKGASGSLAVSGDFTFRTATGPDSKLPVISGINLTHIAARNATVAWTTNIPADSQVFYGTTPDCTLFTRLDLTLDTAHSVDLYDLQANRAYYFRVQSKSASGTLAQSNSIMFQTASYHIIKLVVPRMHTKPWLTGETDDSEFTGIAVANLAEVQAFLTFTAFDKAGVKISGAGITNPVGRMLAPGAQLPIIDYQLFGQALFDMSPIGWISIDSSVDTVTCFSISFNASLSMMDGAPVSSALVMQAVFTEIESQNFTDIHVINANEVPANIMFNLRQADGTVRASAIRRIEPWGAVAEALDSIFAGGCAASDYVEVLSDVGIVPFQMMGKVPNYLEALNGQPTSSGAVKLYCPQYVIGGPDRSTISITNLDDFGGRLTLCWYRDDGSQLGPTRELDIARHGKVYIADQSFFVAPGSVMLQGYVEITSNGPRIAGNVVFTDPSQDTFATALPLVSQLERSMVFSQVASDQTNFTGLAILNPNQAAAVATIELYMADGKLKARTDKTIPARQRIAPVLPQLFPELQGQNISSGYIRLIVDKGVAAFSVFGTNDLKTLSAVPPQVIR